MLNKILLMAVFTFLPMTALSADVVKNAEPKVLIEKFVETSKKLDDLSGVYESNTDKSTTTVTLVAQDNKVVYAIAATTFVEGKLLGTVSGVGLYNKSKRTLTVIGGFGFDKETIKTSDLCMYIMEVSVQKGELELSGICAPMGHAVFQEVWSRVK